LIDAVFGVVLSFIVFRISPVGALETLYAFCSKASCADGESPYARLLQASDGSLYGTTSAGGGSSNCNFGCGTVFKITLAGTLTTLHSFDSSDGAGPYAGLIQATDKNLYGTTLSGGANGGTIFSIERNGALTTLYNFQPSGLGPFGELTQATNGALYGTTYANGQGLGTVFSLTIGLGPFVETQPSSGKVGAKIRILGTSLTGATSVSFNGTPARFRVRSRSEITTTVPTGASTGEVKVVTPGGVLSSSTVFRIKP
jgi:uncharacterized repeat protein (TIGR03803 family)